MTLSNAVAKRPTFTMALQTTGYQNLINNTLKDPQRARQFIAAITSAVAVNPALQECHPKTVLAGALLGESLNLTPSPQLGQYYLVPFKDKSNPDGYEKTAQFILGYKGYIQLAIRSGYYKKINVLPIKTGELISFDPLSEEIIVQLIDDEDAREAATTEGYYAMFEYQNGFKKAIYWSKAKMLNHADKYSAAFNKKAYQLILEGKINEKDMWKYSSYWYKDFDGMAQKTMLRQLISKWGVMSIEMQQAIEADDKIVADQNGNYITPDESEPIDVTPSSSQEEKQPEKPKSQSRKQKADNKADNGQKAQMSLNDI